MTASFRAWPVRYVPPEPATPVWTVWISRSPAWPGWEWLDEQTARPWRANRWTLLGYLLSLVVRLSYRVAYRVRRRTAWEVGVFLGHQAAYRPRAAVLRRVARDQQAAADWAEALCRVLEGRTGLPPLGELPPGP